MPIIEYNIENYPQPLSQIRALYYPHMNNKVYLDHAGMSIYSNALVDRTANYFKSHLLFNPHSQSASESMSNAKSVANTEAIVDKTRLDVLKVFNADPEEYDVAFTSNASGSIRLLAQCMKDKYPNFNYVYHTECHTSVLGVRKLSKTFRTFDGVEDLANALDSQVPNLVAWPGQSNFSGYRPPNDTFLKILSSKPDCYTLLDAASLSTTSPADLSVLKPDFVSLSFYKTFGLPDIGGLIFKKSSPQVISILQSKQYFGGGTVDALIFEEDYNVRMAEPHTILEDGTLPIHSIIQLSHAIQIHEETFGSFENIKHNMKILRDYAYNSLSSLQYSNQNPMVEFHERENESHGPIIALTLLKDNGSQVGYYDFQTFASEKNIFFRCGAMCNAGAFQKWTGISGNDIKKGLDVGHTCGDEMDIIDEVSRGVIRISFGAMTTFEDINIFVDCVKYYLLQKMKK